MDREVETIKRILKILPGSNSQLNNFFESDAEIIAYQGKKLLFSIDEFSQEDLFRGRQEWCKNNINTHQMTIVIG